MITASRYATWRMCCVMTRRSCIGRGSPTRPGTSHGVTRTARRGKCWRTRGTESASCSHARSELLLVARPRYPTLHQRPDAADNMDLAEAITSLLDQMDNTSDDTA